LQRMSPASPPWAGSLPSSRIRASAAGPAALNAAIASSRWPGRPTGTARGRRPGRSLSGPSLRWEAPCPPPPFLSPCLLVRAGMRDKGHDHRASWGVWEGSEGASTQCIEWAVGGRNSPDEDGYGRHARGRQGANPVISSVVSNYGEFAT
jgi:hypothetical protein